MCYLNNQTLIVYMSFGCLSKELEQLLNAKNFQNRILNTQRVRLKNFRN